MDYTGFAVYHQDFGTSRFESEKIAHELYDSLEEGKKELFKIEENGNMISIKHN